MDPYGPSQALNIVKTVTDDAAVISVTPGSPYYDLVVQTTGDNAFNMVIDIEGCSSGNTIHVNNADQATTSLSDTGDYSCTGSSDALNFNYPAADLTVPSGITMTPQVSPNLAVACKNDWIENATNHKCKYQSAHRLWRLEEQSLQSCYEACASFPDCKYFSIDEDGHYAGICMGCTSDSSSASHTGFNYYSVCNRADMNGGCRQHHEHSCTDSTVIASSTESSVSNCKQACDSDENCKWYAFDGANCQTCNDSEGVFRGRGKGSDWKTFEKSCELGKLEGYYLTPDLSYR